ncbi:DUF1272 domain-containing protein [Dokdonella sp.]|uniref:DUF1272 domain-containing protein n=1 Tax=Dokdonella sp. TaxID=2291710 RepID=UPI003C5AEDEA
MLELRPNCERCDKNLPPESDAVICSFECTVCAECASDVLAGVCPNCAGNLTKRPVRPPQLLIKYPASSRRIVNLGGCMPA